jgi:exodeoxyribonuclease-3
MGLKIATWNINSVRLRLAQVTRLAKLADADILCLQEIKVVDELFPHDKLKKLFPYQAVNGMKAYNGVAILSKLPFVAEEKLKWCGRDDARHISVTVKAGDAGKIELHNFYIPAGGDEPDPKINDKFAHKLKFMKEMAKWGKKIANPSARRIAVGDFNVAPLEADVWSHKQLLKVVSHTPVEVDHLAKVQGAHRWVDAVRHFIPEDEQAFSWWSYRNRDWRVSNRGRRLDHIWVTPVLKKHLASIDIIDRTRGWKQPSDHCPIVVELKT